MSVAGSIDNTRNGKVLIEAKGLRKWYVLRTGLLKGTRILLRAVDNVDLFIREGETLGLVGESGCGKSTFGRLLLRLEEPDSGSIYFQGKPILDLDRKSMRLLRKQMQIVFQDPFSSLNPRKTVQFTVAEPLVVHTAIHRREIIKRVADLLQKVGLRQEHINRYPQEFSGGQRQRICIARALACNPKFIVCDEPVSSLDVSVQAQVLNLLQDLQEELNLTYLFISHDLSVVRYVSNRIAVMYLGRILEVANKKALFLNPMHPYTRALMSAAPIPNPFLNRKRISLKGDVPSPINPPSGCHFHPRCPSAYEECKTRVPPLRMVQPDHFVACFYAIKS
jgi:oligopeptide transport system ATP-binding protein